MLTIIKHQRVLVCSFTSVATPILPQFSIHATIVNVKFNCCIGLLNSYYVTSKSMVCDLGPVLPKYKFTSY